MLFECIKDVGKYRKGNIVNTEHMTFDDANYIERKIQEGSFKAITGAPENKAIMQSPEIKELQIGE